MIDRIPFTSMALLCCLPAALLDVCPKPFLSNKGDLSCLACRPIFSLSTPQTALSTVARPLRHSLNCHSKRRSLPDTASFM
jgi:hypothetical protein